MPQTETKYRSPVTKLQGKVIVIEHREAAYATITKLLRSAGYAADRIVRHMSAGEAREINSDDTLLILTNTLSGTFDGFHSRFHNIPVLHISDELDIEVAVNPATTAEHKSLGKISYPQKLLMAVELAGTLRKIAKCMQQESLQTDNEENILESLTEGVFVVNRKWKFTHINKQFEYYFKKDRKSLLGRCIWKAFPEAKNSVSYKAYHRAVEEQVSVQFEEYAPALNMWLSVRAYPEKDGLAVYLTDITEQKKTQEDLSSANQNLSAMINNTKDIIWTIDKSGNVISANDAFWDRVTRMTGKKTNTVDAADFDKGMFDTWQQYYKKAFAGEAYKVTWTETNNGDTTYEEVSFNPMYDKAGNVTGLSCFSKDVTEQQLRMETIEKQNEQFRKIAWAQSHEFRAPVATILGLLQLYNIEDTSDAQNIDILSKVKEAAETLDETIRRINTYTKTKEDVYQLKPQCISKQEYNEDHICK